MPDGDDLYRKVNATQRNARAQGSLVSETWNTSGLLKELRKYSQVFSKYEKVELMQMELLHFHKQPLGS